MLATPGDKFDLGDARSVRLEQHERTGRFAPFLVRPGDDRRFHHLRMAVEAFFDFQRADVFAARDDDVLSAILDLDVVVGMPHGEVAGVVPPAAKCSRRGRLVLEITFHHRVAAKHDLAHRRRIARHRNMRVGIGDRQLRERRHRHALSRHLPRALGQRKLAPPLLRRAQRRRPVRFGQAVEMRHPKAHLLHGLDDRRRRRGASSRHLDDVIETQLCRGRSVHQHIEHDRRSAEMGDAVVADGRKDQCRIDTAQANMRAPGRGHRPGVRPAAAVEHRQRPQVDALGFEAEGEGIGERVEISAAMMVDDALGIAGRTRCVEQRQGVPLVVGPGPGKVGIALGEERRVIDRAKALAGRPLGIRDVDDEQALVELGQSRLDRRGEFGIGEQNLRPAVREAEGDRSRVKPVVQRVQDCAQCGHRVMGFEQRRDIGRHQRDGIGRRNHSKDSPRD